MKEKSFRSLKFLNDPLCKFYQIQQFFWLIQYYHIKSVQNSKYNIFEWLMWKRNPNCAYLGSELELDTYETHFNEDLMATKHQELAQAFYSSDFPPAKTFYQGKNIV